MKVLVPAVKTNGEGVCRFLLPADAVAPESGASVEGGLVPSPEEDGSPLEPSLAADVFEGAFVLGAGGADPISVVLEPALPPAAGADGETGPAD